MARGTHRYVYLAFVAYLAFVVYGSLLPFELRDLSFPQALQAFADIRFLDLDVASRADWIANIVLYIPLAFLGCTWAAGTRRLKVARSFAIGLVFVFCVSIAVTIEFTQLFFAPRTVSLNDLLAETIGTALGIALWIFARERMSALWQAFETGGRQSLLAAITLYGLLYLILALFPYDFVISLAELRDKMSSDKLGWLIAGDCSSLVRCAAGQVGELIAIAPLGLLLALASPRLSLYSLFVLGLLLGLMLELLQLLLASGTSQGLSVLARGAGLVAGASLGRAMRSYGPVPTARLLWSVGLIAAVPYAIAIATVNGWFAARWLSLDDGYARLAQVKLLPFYHHYFTSEPKAMASLLAQVTLYAPVGVFLWAGSTRKSHPQRPHLPLVALSGAALALPIELGKLMVPTKHPDFTNLLIAAGGAAFAYWLTVWISSVLTGGEAHRESTRRSAATRFSETVSGAQNGNPIGLLISVLAAIAMFSGLVNYPTGIPALALLLLGYGILLFYRPWLWLLLLPALLPVLDLSPITGRLLLDEFDLLILVTLVLGYWRLYPKTARHWPTRYLPLAFGLLWATWVVATIRGLWPLLNWPNNVLASSHSPYEAWSVGKGLLWTLLLVPLLRRVPAAKIENAQQLLLNGLVIGLALVCGIVLWERHVFVGIWNFESVFRVTGSFSNMHTGGAYIEAFIAFAFPVLVVWVLMRAQWQWRLAGILLAVVAAYAMLVTFSRGGYAGLVAGLIVVGLATWHQQAAKKGLQAMTLAGLVVGVIAVAVPVLSGEFAQYRVSHANRDLSTRLSHWSHALQLMDDGVATTLTGMGFGRYPTQYLYSATMDKPPGSYSVLREDGQTFLRLGAGESVFLDQLVAVEPDTSYTLTANIRQPYGEAQLLIPICEKALLYSFECSWHRMEPIPDDADATWHRVTIRVESGLLGSGGHWPHRPVKLSLSNGSGNNPIDVSAVSLKANGGRELLANGGFSKGVARWLFVTDQDLAWHIHQQEIEMYFAQGLLGLLALAILLVAVFQCTWPAVRAGNPFATAIAGALAAFLTVGLLGSTMDTARLSMLFYLGALAAALLVKRQQSSTGH
jgi:glycopeptide antibiotics resistance protein